MDCYEYLHSAPETLEQIRSSAKVTGCTPTEMSYAHFDLDAYMPVAWSQPVQPCFFAC